MQDEPKNPTDTPLPESQDSVQNEQDFDDIEFEDIDLDEDIEIDDWDDELEDIDDAAPAQGAEDDFVDLDNDEPAAAIIDDAVTEKTFLQKYFTIIVVAIVAVFAGLWLLGSGILGGNNNAAPISNEQIASTDDASLEPGFSAPDTGINDDTNVAGFGDIDALPPQPSSMSNVAIEDAVLTPMPTLEAAPVELADEINARDEAALDDVFAGHNVDRRLAAPVLEFEEEVLAPRDDITALQPAENIEFSLGAAQNEIPMLEPADAFSPENMGDDAAVLEDNSAAFNAPIAAQSNVAARPDPALSQAAQDELNAITAEAEQAKAALNTLEQQSNTLNASLDNNKASLEVLSAQVQSAATQKEAVIGDIEALETQKEELLKENTSLSTLIDSSNNELDAIRKELETARKALDGVKAERDLMQNDIAMAAAAPIKIVEKEAPKPSAPKVKAAPIKAKTNIKKTSVKKSLPAPKVKATPKAKWVLRGAKPGEATIARAGSNDLKTVETGQNVQSLGTIQSIKIENGRWVVRGTQGSVSQ